MWILFILYLCGGLLCFVHLTLCLEEEYGLSIFIAVFYPGILAILYVGVAIALIVLPILDIIDKIKKPKMENENDERSEF